MLSSRASSSILRRRTGARSASSAEQPSNFINDGTAVVIAASLRRQRKPFDE
jgi:hypothetical protein